MKNLTPLENRILNTITENDLILNNQTVLLAFSGGADSTALLFILKKLSKIIGFNVFAFHLNHMIRGADADRDENRCVEICRDLDIICYTKKLPVKQYAGKKNMSVEQAGREIRYFELFSLKRALKADRIITAHHFDDNVETILMRCLRGTGVDGMCGIELMRKDGIIRPLLHTKKTEILNYLNKNNISYCVDATNYENNYFRNKIRNSVLPDLKRINPGFENIITALIAQAKITKEKIDEELKYYENHITVKNNSAKINMKMLNCAECFLRPYIIRHMIAEINGLSDIEKKNIDSILSMPQYNTVWSIDLPGGTIAKREYDYLIIKRRNLSVGASENIIYPIKIDSENIIEPLKIKIIIRRGDIFKKNRVSEFEKYIDYDKIIGNIFLRGRKTGDKIYPLNMKGSVSLKKYFINNKIPKEKRDAIPILCDEKNIIWIIGYALSDKYKVDEKTKNILKVTAESLEQDDA
jgi:tRNA(Ile)-lysidine synthase